MIYSYIIYNYIYIFFFLVVRFRDFRLKLVELDVVVG
jgi:hypothetical protein